MDIKEFTKHSEVKIAILESKIKWHTEAISIERNEMRKHEFMVEKLRLCNQMNA